MPADPLHHLAPARPARHAALDVARGLGLLLVVLGHSRVVSSDPGWVFGTIFGFHVPLFFFLSGLFLDPSRRLAAYALERLDGLLKPYAVVLGALGLLKLGMDLLQGGGLQDSLLYAWGVLWGTGATLKWVPMWFLPHLALALVAALAVLKLARGQAVAVVLVAAGSLVLGIATIGRFWAPEAGGPVPPFAPGLWAGLPWSLDLLPVSLAFVLLGYLVRGRTVQLAGSWAGTVLALGGFIALRLAFHQSMDLNYRVYGEAAVSTLQALLGIYLTLALAGRLARYRLPCRLLAWVGQGTLFILIFHSTAQGRVFDFLLPATGSPVLAGAAGFLAGVLLPLGLWALLQRSVLASLLLLPVVARRRG